MDFSLNEEQQKIRDLARSVAEKSLLSRARQADREGSFPLDQVKELAKDGFLSMLVPQEHGGLGAGYVNYSLSVTELARCCAATSVTMAVTNMVADAICAWGTEEQIKKYVPGIASGELVAGSFALSEPAAGSDAANLKATAKKDGDRYILNGSKAWITSGDNAGVLLVMARTNPDLGSRGISAFMVEPSMSGFSVGRHEEKMGQRASSTVTINLDDVVVPEANRLGDEGVGFKVAMRALDGGRIGVGSQAVGIGQAALEAAAGFAAEKKELSNAQAIQWKLADMATELDAARLLTLRAASLKDRGLPFTREASMAKYYAAEVANKATLEAIQIHGLDGYTDEHQVERYFRDVRVTTIYEGTSQIQQLVLARSVLAQA